MSAVLSKLLPRGLSNKELPVSTTSSPTTSTTSSPNSSSASSLLSESIDSLTIEENIDNNVADELRKKIEKSRILSFLVIKGERLFKCEGLLFIFKAISVNRSVKVLSLYDIPSFDVSHWKQYLEYLQQNRSIQTLVISECRVDEARGLLLAQFLKENKTISSLQFNEVTFDSNVVDHLAKALTNNSFIQNLSFVSLSYVRPIELGIDGLKSILEMLMANRSIHSLTIDGRSLDNTWTTVLGDLLLDILKYNTVLEKFDIQIDRTKTQLGFISAVAKTIKVNTRMVQTMAALNDIREFTLNTSRSFLQVIPGLVLFNNQRILSQIVLYYRYGVIGIWDMENELLCTSGEIPSFEEYVDQNIQVIYYSIENYVVVFTTKDIYMWDLTPNEAPMRVSCTYNLAVTTYPDFRTLMNTCLLNRNQFKTDLVKVMLLGYSAYMKGCLFMHINQTNQRATKTSKRLVQATFLKLSFDVDGLNIVSNPIFTTKAPFEREDVIHCHLSPSGEYVCALTFPTQIPGMCRLFMFQFETKTWIELYDSLEGGYLAASDNYQLTFLSDTEILITEVKRTERHWYNSYWIVDIVEGHAPESVFLKMNLVEPMNPRLLCPSSSPSLHIVNSSCTRRVSDQKSKYANAGAWDVYLYYNNDWIVHASIDKPTRSVRESLRSFESYQRILDQNA